MREKQSRGEDEPSPSGLHCFPVIQRALDRAVDWATRRTLQQTPEYLVKNNPFLVAVATDIAVREGFRDNNLWHFLNGVELTSFALTAQSSTTLHNEESARSELYVDKKFAPQLIRYFEIVKEDIPEKGKAPRGWQSAIWTNLEEIMYDPRILQNPKAYMDVVAKVSSIELLGQRFAVKDEVAMYLSFHQGSILTLHLIDHYDLLLKMENLRKRQSNQQ